MKTIKFLLDPHFMDIPAPIPASSDIPTWYRNGEMFIDKETGLKEITNEEAKGAGMRSCMPFFDAITSGYLLTTWWDIEITKNEDGVIEFQYVEKNAYDAWIKSHLDVDLIGERKGDIGHTMPRPSGYAQNHMIWKSKWGWRVPKGWSVIVTHPMNRFELPFITSSGFMESDRFSANGNIPFYIKDGFTGIIPKGTPYAQLIPIKRSEWVAIAKKKDAPAEFESQAVRSENYGIYRSKMWIPKKYRSKNV